jgi:hypothetical protein
MEMEEIFERLVAILDADRKARREDIRSIWFEESIIQEEMEADAEKMEPDSEVMQSVMEHQEVTVQDATVMPVREPGVRSSYELTHAETTRRKKKWRCRR